MPNTRRLYWWYSISIARASPRRQAAISCASSASAAATRGRGAASELGPGAESGPGKETGEVSARSVTGSPGCSLPDDGLSSVGPGGSESRCLGPEVVTRKGHPNTHNAWARNSFRLERGPWDAVLRAGDPAVQAGADRPGVSGDCGTHLG